MMLRLSGVAAILIMGGLLSARRLAGSFYPCVLQGNGARIDPGFEQQLYLHVPQV